MVVVLNPKIISIACENTLLIVELKEKLTRDEIFKIIANDLIVTTRIIQDLDKILLLFRNSETFLCKEIIAAQEG